MAADEKIRKSDLSFESSNVEFPILGPTSNSRISAPPGPILFIYSLFFASLTELHFCLKTFLAGVNGLSSRWEKPKISRSNTARLRCFENLFLEQIAKVQAGGTCYVFWYNLGSKNSTEKVLTILETRERDASFDLRLISVLFVI